MGNSSGSSHETRTLAYYDRLPKSVRFAVQNARFDWALRWWLKKFEEGSMSADELVKRVHAADRELSAKERRKVWGPDYPIFKGELPDPVRARRRSSRR
jgi:hypothetical protein